MKLTALNFRRAFSGVALISALTVAGVASAHAAPPTAAEIMPVKVTEPPTAPALEAPTATHTGTTEVGGTLSAHTNAPAGARVEWLRDGTLITTPAVNVVERI